MKKIGIVGGLAWPSTVEYYAGLCRRTEQWHVERGLPPQAPEMAIESVNLAKAFSYIGTDGDEASWSKFDGYHRAALERLERSGAGFALLAANTPHHRFDAIVRGLRIPVLSIIEATARVCARLDVRELLLLGTSVTMSSLKFREQFAQHGIEAIAPPEGSARRTTIDLITDLQQGREQGAAERLSSLAKSQLQACFPNQTAAVCLGCTELPLAFRENAGQTSFEHDGLLYINTTLAHIEAAFEWAVS